jgi:hypothetical protein
MLTSQFGLQCTEEDLVAETTERHAAMDRASKPLDLVLVHTRLFARPVVLQVQERGLGSKDVRQPQHVLEQLCGIQVAKAFFP